jgi:heavy metal sensor kinase
VIAKLSIRVRLTAAFAAAMILVLALAGAFVYLKVRSDLTEVLEESLNSRADDVAALTMASGAAPPDLGGERLVDGEDSFAQILDVRSGGVVASTLPTNSGPAISPAEVKAAGREPVLSERAVPGVDGEAKVLARSVQTPAGESIVVVGATTQDRSEALAGLTGAFVVGGPLAIVLASLLGYGLAGRALAPVESMRRRAAGITLERSGERLPLPEADDELHRLGETLNQMLDRIEDSLERERAFVADASHELRTPLAILRTELELAGRPGRSPEELRAALRSTGEEVDRLSRLAEDLLVIARSDQGRIPIARRQVDLPALLDRVRERFAARATGMRREIVISASPGSHADLDALRIEQALGNLVDNALRHGAGDVGLAARTDSGTVVLEVSDEGEGFPADFRGRAFERFSRADDGRTGGGTGLGLAIVRAVAEAHGGDATVVTSPTEPEAVRITIPPVPLR